MSLHVKGARSKSRKSNSPTAPLNFGSIFVRNHGK